MPDLTALKEAATAEARSEILAAIQSSGQSPAGEPVGHGEIRLRGADPAPAATPDPSPRATEDAPGEPAGGEAAPADAGRVGHGRILLR